MSFSRSDTVFSIILSIILLITLSLAILKKSGYSLLFFGIGIIVTLLWILHYRTTQKTHSKI